MAVRTAYDPTAGEILTATNLERLPGGWIGYNEVTTSQTGISAITDLTGLSLTVTVGPSRKICIRGHLLVDGDTANNVATMQIQEGATVLQGRIRQLSATAGRDDALEAAVVINPTAGAHTYKLTLQLGGGEGTVASIASVTAPAWILVEDVGPSA